ncbi:MAG TPA: molecular chaperone DnaJ [Propionicimonas sp.]|jgi:molecular chaperone DnaJ|uniref:molecular chaperone DnaJ n=1 Tax=Propionicimonas sp. TaxID=1955623 RepID=UPI002F42867B
MSTKDWLEKDYYKVLGVSKDAKPDEIKKAFRKLAREFHPDQNADNAGAEARFKEISEANSILSDPAKRKEYDEARSLFGGGGFRFPGAGQGGGPSMEDLFRGSGAGDSGISDLFGNLFGGTTTRRTTRGPRRGADIEGEVTIDFADSLAGSLVSMQTTSDAACETCHGTGARPGTQPTVCRACQGSGMQTSTSGGVFAVSEPCRECRGRGMVVESPCPTCAGSGRSRSTRTMQVRIPAGVTDGQRIRIKGKGGAGENSGAAGDLYVLVHVRPHKIFGRKGEHITITVPVTFAEAALGAEIGVPTLDGSSVRLKIPAGTPNGRTFRVRGRGVKGGAVDGDMLVTVDVQVPRHLTEEARAALVEFQAKAGGGDPREHLLGSH